jgi:glucan 1,3-beta-glucosidase
MDDRIIGVNIGGWLLAEKWMTPSLFKGSGASNEFELASTKQGRQRLKHHHDTFITESDLRWLKDHGVTHLRIPFGHWCFSGDERYVNSLERLDWIVRTSLSYDFKLLLDLHAAPGAQNRAEHSGSGNVLSDKHSTKWLNDKSAQDETVRVLVEVAKRYYEYPHIWGLQLLNEPTTDLLGLKLARFYRKAYRALENVVRPSTNIVYSDGYAPLRLTNALGLMAKKHAPAVMDCHFYHTFSTRDANRTFAQHLAKTRRTRRLISFLQLFQPIIVGEYSAVLPYSPGPKRTEMFVRAQLDAYQATAMTFYWNYKTETGGRWNFRNMVEAKEHLKR